MSHLFAKGNKQAYLERSVLSARPTVADIFRLQHEQRIVLLGFYFGLWHGLRRKWSRGVLQSAQTQLTRVLHHGRGHGLL